MADHSDHSDQSTSAGIVVDINVYLHAMTPGGRFRTSSQQALVTMLEDPKFHIETSEHILDNIYDKLQSQLGYPEPEAAEIIVELEEILTTQTQVRDPDPNNLTDFIADREDDNILALAADSDAKLIVTNDFRDLVSLGSWRSTPVLPSTKFNEYARTGTLPARHTEQLSPAERIKQLLAEHPGPDARQEDPVYD